MATPVHLTGFECGSNPTTNGLGLWNSVNGSPVVDTSIKRTGAYSLKIVAPGAGQAYNCRKNIGASVQVAVATFHFYVPTGGLPSANTIMCGFTFGTSTGTAGLHLRTDGEARAQVGSGTTVGSTIFSLDQWHRVDFRLNITTSTWTLEWYLDGVQQTNATQTGQATNDNIAGFRFGSSSTTATYTIYFDDLLVSETSGDYPIGDIAVEALFPSSDGTHNAGTNVIEDQAGNDIGAATAYNKINNAPPNGATYIRQAANGTGNYAEVLFGDIQAPHSVIHGALAILAYTSETTTSNNGACMVSKDGFSTNTPVWGSSGAQADYSDGTTSAPWFKTAIIAGANSTSTVNSLSARMGYSGDANPDPYWINLVVEVAYVPSSDINLDLVTYSITVNDVTILENVVESLDLVTYSSTFNDVTFPENIVDSLDLVTYSITFNDVTILENIVESLDLVSYSSSFDDITILEHVVETMDLVSYSISFNDVVILENVIEELDLATYSSTVNDLTILENIADSLDLVSYTSTFQDIDLLEEGSDNLDLVTYSNTFYDLDVLENVVTDLDLVSYSSTFEDIDLLEEGIDNLDLVTYSNTFYDLDVLENVVIDLDLVSYSSIVYDVEFLEEGELLLDFVSYSSTFNDVLFESQDEPVIVYYGRVYSILKENRAFAIERETRFAFFEREIRIF